MVPVPAEFTVLVQTLTDTISVYRGNPYWENVIMFSNKSSKFFSEIESQERGVKLNKLSTK